jgi:hypothetical protein
VEETVAKEAPAAAMALLETVARDAATIVVQECRRTAAARREVTEAEAINVAANAARMEAAARYKAYRAADAAEEEGRVAETRRK